MLAGPIVSLRNEDREAATLACSIQGLLWSSRGAADMPEMCMAQTFTNVAGVDLHVLALLKWVNSTLPQSA